MGNLYGFVIDPTLPVDECDITGAVVTAGGRTGVWDAWSNPGRYYWSINGIHAGYYDVTASATGYFDQTKHVQVLAGYSNEVVFLLQKISLASSKPTIMTGGVADSAHQCTITATVILPVFYPYVFFEIVGSTGHNIPASLSAQTAQVDASGHASVTLTSSDLVEAVTVKAEYGYVGSSYEDTITVNQTDWAFTQFALNPDNLLPDGESTADILFSIVQRGTSTPLQGHHIIFSIDSIYDWENNLVPRENWGLYGSIDQPQNPTNANGQASGTFHVGTEPGLIFFRAEDDNVWYP